MSRLKFADNEVAASIMCISFIALWIIDLIKNVNRKKTACATDRDHSRAIFLLYYFMLREILPYFFVVLGYLSIISSILE